MGYDDKVVGQLRGRLRQGVLRPAGYYLFDPLDRSRSHWVHAGSLYLWNYIWSSPARGAVLKKMAEAVAVASEVSQVCAGEFLAAGASSYPHSCPRCGGPAYVGLNDIDCSRKDCHP